uniref:Uncharacterized protein n=1 Tax=Fagus sylvatica TaxID=28930 RepID=A0A2N9FDX5_FAGSY
MNYFYIHFLSLLGLFGASLSLSLSFSHLLRSGADLPVAHKWRRSSLARGRDQETASIDIHSNISPSQPIAGPRRRLKPRPSNVTLGVGDYVAAVWGLQRWVLVGSHMGLIVGYG